MEKNRIVWLTGTSGAGKTTVARALQREWPCVILDGDEMRDSISLGAGFSKEDRREHNLRIARLARELVRQTNVLVSVIAPMEEVRREIERICIPTWIYVKRTMPDRPGHFYEEPLELPVLDHDVLSVKESVEQLKVYLGIQRKEKYSLFIGRWQPLHDGHKALFDAVRQEGKKLLIGIRDTEISPSDPYSVAERVDMIHKEVPDARIVVLPDVEEIVHGRKVGWGIRQIHLPEDIESISATGIRNQAKG